MVTIPEAFPQAFACFDRLSTSLGVSCSIRASGLVACSRIWENTRRVSPFRMSILRQAQDRWGQFPFGPACQGRSAERPYSGRFCTGAAPLRPFRHTFVSYP